MRLITHPSVWIDVILIAAAVVLSLLIVIVLSGALALPPETARLQLPL
jgi:hypothetical protein